MLLADVAGLGRCYWQNGAAPEIERIEARIEAIEAQYKLVWLLTSPHIARDTAARAGAPLIAGVEGRIDQLLAFAQRCARERADRGSTRPGACVFALEGNSSERSTERNRGDRGSIPPAARIRKPL
jgi:hypothetical protein